MWSAAINTSCSNDYNANTHSRRAHRIKQKKENICDLSHKLLLIVELLVQPSLLSLITIYSSIYSFMSKI